MLILFTFAFLAGIVTILSPCILPILPIILSSSLTGGKSRPIGTVLGFVASFTFFTLFLSIIVQALKTPPDTLRLLSIVIIFGFGASLLIPRFQLAIEQLFAKLSNFTPEVQNKSGLFGGILIGLSLGLIWTPCVGPILASVISLALTGTVTTTALFITLAYSLGTAVPMFVIIATGRKLFEKLPWLLANTAKIQKAFGIIMMLTAIGIYFNVDRKFQTFVLDKFPQYGTSLTSLEDNDAVRRELQNLNAPQDQTSLGIAPEIIPGGQWFNSSPLTLAQLKGKVVLIDFWTYSCINCIRTLPYLRSWWDKYKDEGLVIIGVHSPEFEFEKDPDNLAKAISDFNLTYPIVQDNNFATWRAYNNRYWPAKYLIDKSGTIRYSHFGEGAYDETEKNIQELLQVSLELQNPDYSNYARTPELYLGSARMIPPPNQYFSFEGKVTIEDEYSNPQAGTKLTLNFEAKDVFLVINPQNGSSRIKVFLDGQAHKTITANEDKLYELVSLDSPGKHTLSLEFLDSNSQIYAFTFG